MLFGNIGYPVVLQSDNGSEFINQLIIDWLKQHGVKYAHSKPYTPQTQGKIERQNRTLKDRLFKSMSEGDDWFSVLQSTVLAINNCVTRSTKQSPYLSVYGLTHPNYRGRPNASITEHNQLEFDSMMNESGRSGAASASVSICPSITDNSSAMLTSMVNDPDYLEEIEVPSTLIADVDVTDLDPGERGCVGVGMNAYLNSNQWRLRRVGTIGAGRCGLASILTALSLTPNDHFNPTDYMTSSPPQQLATCDYYRQRIFRSTTHQFVKNNSYFLERDQMGAIGARFMVNVIICSVDVSFLIDPEPNGDAKRCDISCTIGQEPFRVDWPTVLVYHRGSSRQSGIMQDGNDNPVSTHSSGHYECLQRENDFRTLFDSSDTVIRHILSKLLNEFEFDRCTFQLTDRYFNRRFMKLNYDEHVTKMKEQYNKSKKPTRYYLGDVVGVLVPDTIKHKHLANCVPAVVLTATRPERKRDYRYTLGVVNNNLRYLLQHYYTADQLVTLNADSFAAVLQYPIDGTSIFRLNLWTAITASSSLYAAYQSFICPTSNFCVVCSADFIQMGGIVQCASCHLSLHGRAIDGRDCKFTELVTRIDGRFFCSQRCQQCYGSEKVFITEILKKVGTQGRVKYHVRYNNHEVDIVAANVLEEEEHSKLLFDRWNRRMAITNNNKTQEQKNDERKIEEQKGNEHNNNDEPYLITIVDDPQS